MRTHEFINESGDDVLVINDNYGGTIRIRPNPKINKNPQVFSMSYINQIMATAYGVKPRMLGFDSHGHHGVPAAHLHGFTLHKNTQVAINNQVLDVSYLVLIDTFYGLYSALLNKFTTDIQNGNIKLN